MCAPTLAHCAGAGSAVDCLMAAETGSAVDGLMAVETGSAADGLVAHVFTTAHASTRFGARPDGAAPPKTWKRSQAVAQRGQVCAHLNHSVVREGGGVVKHLDVH